MCKVFNTSQGGFALLFDESASSSAPIAFGTYRVLHQTGSGALGPVFRAFDPRQDRLVAVKAFKLDLLPEHVARFADALRRLVDRSDCHPALVPVCDAGIEGTTPFVVMPCQSGETLDVVMRRLPPLSLDEALKYLTPVAEAIDAAVSAGVDHGALHPRDIFISASGSVHVTGFGIARALASVNAAADTIRRPYAAPERSGVWDARADLYSLGVIAHELLTRCRPAGVGEQDGVFSASITPQHRVRLRKVLAGALAETPGQRYATGADFIDALTAIGVRDIVAPGARSFVSAPVDGMPRQAALDLPSVDPATELAAGDGYTGPARVENRVANEDVPADVAYALAPIAVPDPFELHAASTSPISEAAAPEISESDAGATVAGVPAVASPPVAEPSFADVLATVPLQRVPLTLVNAAGRRHLSRTSRHGQTSPRLLVAAFAIAAVVVGALAAYFAGAYQPTRRVSMMAAAPAPREDAPDAAVGQAPPSAGLESLPAVIPSAETDAQTNAARRDSTRDVRRVSALAAGRLVIRSEPSGALVTVDGRSWGATPITVRDLSLGTHAVRVARPGHVPRVERVTLRATAPTQTLTLALAPGLDALTPALGAIDIDSRPRAARVIVDGRFLGQAPLRIPQLRPGVYAVTLELDGYTSWTSRVTVEAGKSAALRPALRSTN